MPSRRWVPVEYPLQGAIRDQKSDPLWIKRGSEGLERNAQI